MRKSGLYLSGPYGQYTGEYGDYIEWREKSISRTGKNIIIFLLAAVMAVVSVNPIAEYRNQIKAASGQASQVSVAEGADKEQFFLIPGGQQETMPGVPAENPKKEPGEALILLDPGHGGEDEGCSREGAEEKEINLRIAYQLQKKLLEMGYRVRLTRNGDRELTLEERAKPMRREPISALASTRTQARRQARKGSRSGTALRIRRKRASVFPELSKNTLFKAREPFPGSWWKARSSM